MDIGFFCSFHRNPCAFIIKDNERQALSLNPLIVIILHAKKSFLLQNSNDFYILGSQAILSMKQYTLFLFLVLNGI